MTIFDWTNYLTVIALVLFIIAIIYLIILLHRANRIVSKVDHLSDTFRGFVADIVPAIVNMGTVVTAVQSVLRQLVDHHKDKPKTKK